MASREQKRKHWFHHIEQWQDSGLTQAQYCNEHGLSVISFRYYLKLYTAKDAAKVESTALVPVEVIPDPEEAPIVDHASALQAFTLTTPKGFKVELPPGFDLAGLKQLIQVLEAA